MSYITKIFERAQLPRLRSFLLDGVELLGAETASYEKRLKDSSNIALEAVKRYFPDGCEPLEEVIIRSTALTGEVYMEIGLQVGAMLAARLLTPPQ